MCSLPDFLACVAPERPGHSDGPPVLTCSSVLFSVNLSPSSWFDLVSYFHDGEKRFLSFLFFFFLVFGPYLKFNKHGLNLNSITSLFFFFN